MAWFSRAPAEVKNGPALVVEGLDVYYGRAHALQKASLSLNKGVLAVVGRNGMGKSTLCNAIAGLVASTGSIRLYGKEIRGLNPNTITTAGVGYVPQGRRVWPSLTVHEHLKLAATSARKGAWTIERVYQTFPRLAERKQNGGAQLSGGEQQMLAIGRALLFNPSLLVMDEPTEGLAPVIVQQVAGMLRDIAASGEIAILLIEQNLGVAMDVADDIAVMVNGQLAHKLTAQALAADRELQTRLLGVRQSEDEDDGEDNTTADSIERARQADKDDQTVQVFTVKRAGDVEAPSLEEERSVAGFNRWNATSPGALRRDFSLGAPAGQWDLDKLAIDPERVAVEKNAKIFEFPVAQSARKVCYIVGTFDTKAKELYFLQNSINRLGLMTLTVDLSTGGQTSAANVAPQEVARYHPEGARAVFSNDRGAAVGAMTLAFERYMTSRRDVGGIISAGGSGGTAMASAGMRRLAIGIPKVLVSTMASGDVRPYVGPSDICMMYSVTDVSGINRISEKVLGNAAHALAGMVAHGREATDNVKPAVGLTMFGVTTPCVQSVTKLLQDQYDCLVFHATGTGGQSMEKLVESGLLAAVLDITTTEIADEIVGGVLSAGPDRLDIFSKVRIPYFGSCGALDMVNFAAKNTVPQKFQDRKLIVHNSNVTLMRTTRAECEAIGRFLAGKLNRMLGPVRFFIPEGGVSMLDARGQPFYDSEADDALFRTLELEFRPGPDRRLIRLPFNINDPEFTEAMVKEFRALMASQPFSKTA
jgi:uncharacterized protein (UPF0261 family)/ABC-type branched-subunit amino acid transport system ATPase component